MHTHEPSQQESQGHESESGFDGSAFQLTQSSHSFVDARPESTIQRSQQLAANRSPQVTQLQALQRRVSQGPRRTQAPAMQLMTATSIPAPLQLTPITTPSAPIQRTPQFKNEEEAIIYFEEWETDEEFEAHYDEVLDIKTIAMKKGWNDLVERIDYRLSTFQAEVGPSLSEAQLRMEWEALDKDSAGALESATAMLLRAQEYDWQSLEEEIIQFVRQEEDERDGLQDNGSDTYISPERAPAAWFNVPSASPAGQWITRIMETPFDKIREEFGAYVKHYYDTVDLQSNAGPGQHVKQVIEQIEKAKRLIEPLRRGMEMQLKQGKQEDDPIILRIRAKIQSFIDVIVRMVPQPPAYNVRILANQDVVVPNNGSPEGKLIHKGSDWFIVGKDGQEHLANGHYCFVVPVQTGEVLVGTRANGGHTMLSRGGDVYYAGELKLTNGQLDFWENESGHYRTTEDQKDIIAQIGLGNVLPLGKFRKAH